MKGVHKSIIVVAAIAAAVGGGYTLGQHLGLSFAGMWAEQNQELTFDYEYQSVIDQNIQKLEEEDAVPAYRELEGYQGDGVLVEQMEDWRLVLVNKWNEMEAGYVPELTEVGDGHQVDSRIAQSLRDMIRGAKSAGYYIYILSSYRDMEKQIDLYEAEVEKWLYEGYSQEAAEEKAGTIVAIPGTSEHHLGLAVDLVDSTHIALDEGAEKTKGYQWLVAHCHEYGFILRYPNGATDITGIIYEPWHFRYVGEEAAAEIMQEGITLEEYLSRRVNDRALVME